MARPQPSGAPPISERARVLGPFLERHWRLPVPAQGPAPDGFDEVEASLDPATCGACHPEQHAQWRTSLHARAYSPGFSGQLLEGALAAAPQVRQCQTCHAPLEEQQPHAASGEANPVFDPALREQGIVCAACHVRTHRRYGPPRRADAPPLSEPVPHGGFTARPEYREARFCAPCHQFFDRSGVNGKPVQDTFREWQESPHAAAGQSCQSCHMPDRAHLWRGIHDPETVRAAVPAELFVRDAEPGRVRGALVLAAEGVGHAFPSYVTPRVFVAMWQEDAEGRALPGTRVAATIGREIDFSTSPWTEVFDTRIPAGESVRLDYERARHEAAVGLAGRVTVAPGHHYEGVFRSLLGTLEDPEARRRIARALRDAEAARYTLHDLEKAL